jgi:hypothetical protein
MVTETDPEGGSEDGGEFVQEVDGRLCGGRFLGGC